MRIFLDTEFMEDGRTIELLSIGMVAEDGRCFYAESAEADRSLANEWVSANVLPHLSGPILPRREIALGLYDFAGNQPEFWGYYSDYDWVVVCQLYGTMLDLPETWPTYCLDLKQWCYQLGDPKLPSQGKGEHHALLDAKWNESVYKFLLDQSRG